MGKAAPLALEPLPLANWPMHLVRTQAGIDDAFVHHAWRETLQGCRDRFGIGYATFQIENGDPGHACQLAPANVV